MYIRAFPRKRNLTLLETRAASISTCRKRGSHGGNASRLDLLNAPDNRRVSGTWSELSLCSGTVRIIVRASREKDFPKNFHRFGSLAARRSPSRIANPPSRERELAQNYRTKDATRRKKKIVRDDYFSLITNSILNAIG